MAGKTSKHWTQQNRASTRNLNDLYIRSLGSTISGFSRAVLVSVGTAAFKAAVTAAYQDSGRAANNVRMSAGLQDLDMTVDATRGVPPVGKTREHRSDTGADSTVIDARFLHYGVKEGEFPAKSDYLIKKVGSPKDEFDIGIYRAFKGAKVKEVHVYSPIGSAIQGGEYMKRAYESGKRPHTVKEAIGAAVHIQTQLLKEQLNRTRTKEQMRAFITSNY